MHVFLPNQHYSFAVSSNLQKKKDKFGEKLTNKS